MKKQTLNKLFTISLLALLILSGCNTKSIPTNNSPINTGKETTTTITSLPNKSIVDLFDSSLEFDKLSEEWIECDFNAAEIHMGYGYFINEDDDPSAYILVQDFDGEERCYSREGIKDRLKGWHDRDGFKDLVIEDMETGIFGFKYSFRTTKVGTTYKGYIFEANDITFDICFFIYNNALEPGVITKLNKDFETMVASCILIKE